MNGIWCYINWSIVKKIRVYDRSVYLWGISCVKDNDFGYLKSLLKESIIKSDGSNLYNEMGMDKRWFWLSKNSAEEVIAKEGIDVIYTTNFGWKRTSNA